MPKDGQAASRKVGGTLRDEVITFRVTAIEKERLAKISRFFGYRKLSDYLARKLFFDNPDFRRMRKPAR